LGNLVPAPHSKRVLHIKKLLEHLQPRMFATNTNAQEIVAQQHHQRAYAQAQPAAQQNTTCHAARYQRHTQHESSGVL